MLRCCWWEGGMEQSSLKFENRVICELHRQRKETNRDGNRPPDRSGCQPDGNLVGILIRYCRSGNWPTNSKPLIDDKLASCFGGSHFQLWNRNRKTKMVHIFHINYSLLFELSKSVLPLPGDSSSSINHIDLIRVAKAKPSSCWREPVFPPSWSRIAHQGCFDYQAGERDGLLLQLGVGKGRNIASNEWFRKKTNKQKK